MEYLNTYPIPSDNGRDQQIAANGLSTPQDAIAILLHRLVRHLLVDRQSVDVG